MLRRVADFVSLTPGSVIATLPTPDVPGAFRGGDLLRSRHHGGGRFIGLSAHVDASAPGDVAVDIGFSFSIGSGSAPH